MGCNYFCEDKHIGKSSFGWQFYFERHEGLTSYDEWMEYLKDKPIYDEIGDNISLEDFKKKIEGKVQGMNHHTACKVEGYDSTYNDEKGYTFVTREFS